MKAGFSESVITPADGRCFLAGYGGPWSTGVHDDLYASAVYLEDGETRALLVSFDLIGLQRELIDRLKDGVKEAVCIEPDHIFFTCTHTHEGPEVRRRAAAAASLELDYLDGYEAFLVERVATAAQKAVDQARTCEVRVNRAFVDENMNRRFFTASGEYFFVPSYKDLTPITNQCEDKELGIVCFCPPGDRHPYGMILNYAMHPLTAGNTSTLISADVPGIVREVIRESLGCPTCYITGAAGDNHPKAPEGGFAETRRVGQVIATQAITRWFDAYKLEEEPTLKCLTRSVTLKWRTVDELRRIPTAGDLSEERIQAYLDRIKTQGATVEVQFSLLAIGPILLIGVPGELVAELGMMLKWLSPFQRTYVMFQATESFGYIAHPNAYLWGGYEAVAGQLSPSSVRVLIDAIADAAEELASSTA